MMFLAATVLGCGHKEAAAGSPHPPQTVDAPVVTAENQEKILTQLTEAASRYWLTKGQIPGTLDEVVAAGFLKSVPTPPAGQRFVIDPRTAHVELVDQ